MKYLAKITWWLAVCLVAFTGCSDESTSPEEENPPAKTQTYGFNIYRYGAEFQGIWMFSATDWVAVAAEGNILRFKNGKVFGEPTGVRNDLNDIWAAASNSIFVVGDGYGPGPGVILHYNGNTWSQMTHPVTEDIKGVYGFSGTNVYAVTSAGRVLHYDGTSWTEVYQRPGSYALYDVWCSGITNVVAVGESGGIVRWDGASWSDDSVMGPDFYGVWGSAYNNIYACGGNQIWKYDGSWSSDYSKSGANFEEIHGSGADDVWAVGPGELVYHWDGSTWAESSAGGGPYGNDFHAVWAWSATNAVLLSDHGGVFQYDGATWNEINDSGQGGWADMYGLSADLVYAVSGYTLMRWDGTQWAEESSQSAYKTAVWATGEDEVWSCGWPGSGVPRYVYYYDGTSWSQSYSINSSMPWDIWSDGTYVFVVWADGVVSVYDGTSWSHSTVTTPPVDLSGVWGVSATDVFVVGAAGTIYRLQGTVWSEMTSGVGAGVTLDAVWGTSATDVVAVGQAGTVVRFDGTTWTTEDAGVSTNLRAVWADAPNNYWVVGMSGTVLHYDGTSWKSVPTGLSEEIGYNCVWGSGGNNVWVGGDSDFMIRYELR